jgi:hypothetical protein
MGASAHAARRTSTVRRRPAPRKARPAARRGPSRIKWDRLGRVALTLVLVAVFYSYLHPTISLFETYRGTGAAKAKRHQLLQENRALHQRIKSSKDPIVIGREARAQGMVAEGETPTVARGLGG